MNTLSAKRNSYLQPVSREHHFGLLFCWKIRRGIELGVEPNRISKYVMVFWQNYLKPHFKGEELLLFIDGNDRLVQQALDQHRQIEGCLHQIISEGESVSQLSLVSLADALSLHIHFEEKELFPHLIYGLSSLQLQSIEDYLQNTHNLTLKDRYSDEFWKVPGASL